MHPSSISKELNDDSKIMSTQETEQDFILCKTTHVPWIIGCKIFDCAHFKQLEVTAYGLAGVWRRDMEIIFLVLPVPWSYLKIYIFGKTGPSIFVLKMYCTGKSVQWCINLTQSN